MTFDDIIACADRASRAGAEPRSADRAIQVLVFEVGIRDRAPPSREVPALSGLKAVSGNSLDRPRSTVKDPKLDAFIRAKTVTADHLLDSSRMHGDIDAMVRDDLQVNGAEGLCLVGASLRVKLTDRNRNASTVVIADRAASLVHRSGQRSKRSPQ